MNYYSLILLGQLNFFYEVFIPMFILMRRQEKRRFIWLRLAVVAALSVSLVFMPFLAIGPFGMNYLIDLALAFFAAFFIFRVSPLDVLFYVVEGFAIQHLMWDVLFIIFESIGELSQAAALGIYIPLYVVEYVLMFLFMPVSDAHKGGMKGRVTEFVIAALTIAFTYVLSSLIPWFDEWNILYRLYALLCCLFAIGLQCGVLEHTKLKERNKALEQDKFVLEELLSREQKQYAFTKDTIDLINIKCHDLKHQLSVLKSLSEEDREKSLKDVEKAVMIYGNIAKTGNETLDIILTEKSFLCEKYGVRFTYMIDGEGLSFMEPADISSLFGNALDNAIESVMREMQAEKRVIKLNASKKRAYLSVHLENYCSEKVRFKDGLPVSGKADKLNHGFGAKSMRYIVEKYGGAMVMRQEGCLVVLDIILPMGESAGVTEGAAGGEGMPALT